MLSSLTVRIVEDRMPQGTLPGYTLRDGQCAQGPPLSGYSQGGNDAQSAPPPLMPDYQL